MDRTLELSAEKPSAIGLRTPLLLAVALAFVVCFAGLNSHHLWSPDEPTGAAVGREMVESGDLIVPRLNGQPFLEKPPLYWWVQTAALRRWGFTPAAARLPSGLFSALTLLVTFALGRRLAGTRAGLLAMAVLGGTALFVLEAGRVVVDPGLAFLVALAHLGFAILAAPRAPSERRAALLLIALAVPLAFLAKGVVAVGLAVAPPGLWLLLTARRRALRDLIPLALLGIPLFALFVVPWAVALVHSGGYADLRECLINNTIGRLAVRAKGSAYGHTKPFTYYLVAVPVFLLPWSLAIPAIARRAVQRRRSREPGDAVRSLLAGTFALGVLLLSLASSKRELYLLPLLPAFAACAAEWLDGLAAEMDARSRRWNRNTLACLLALAALLPVLLWFAAIGVRRMPHVRCTRIGILPLQAALRPGVLVAFALAVAILCALLLVRLVRLVRSWRGGVAARLSPLWVAVPFLLLFLGIETGVQPLVDPVKSMSDMTAAVSRLLPGSGAVPAYLQTERSSESLYGILSFDLGRRTLPLKTLDSLRAYLGQVPEARVVMRGKAALSLPPDLLGRLVVLYDERGRKAAPFVIASWRPQPGR